MDSPVTLESIQKMLRPKRIVVFCHEDDEPVVAEVCQRLRDEGHQIVHKTSQFIKAGTAFSADADVLQPPKITWEWK